MSWCGCSDTGCWIGPTLDDYHYVGINSAQGVLEAIKDLQDSRIRRYLTKWGINYMSGKDSDGVLANYLSDLISKKGKEWA